MAAAENDGAQQASSDDTHQPHYHQAGTETAPPDRARHTSPLAVLRLRALPCQCRGGARDDAATILCHREDQTLPVALAPRAACVPA